MPMRTFGLLVAALAIAGSAGAAIAPSGATQSGSVPADTGNATNPYITFGAAVFDVQAAPAPAPAPNAVPEPGSLALAGLALAAGLAASRRRGLQTGE